MPRNSPQKVNVKQYPPPYVPRTNQSDHQTVAAARLFMHLKRTAILAASASFAGVAFSFAFYPFIEVPWFAFSALFVGLRYARLVISGVSWGI